MRVSVGQRFGKRTVIGFELVARGYAKARTRCDCGVERLQHPSELLKGLGHECQRCKNARVLHEHGPSALRHGMHGTPEYQAWCSMQDRCYNPRTKSFRHYGGRGIRVARDWRGARGFDAFFAHVGKRPSSGHSLDRIKVNRGYVPGNIRWATKLEQMGNRRVHRMLTLDGLRLTQAAWARRAGLDVRRVHARLAAGWTTRAALTTPIGCARRNKKR